MNREGVAVGAIILGVVGGLVMYAAEHAALGLPFLALVAWGVYLFIQARKNPKHGIRRVYRPESSYTVEEQSDGQLRFHVLVANQRSSAPVVAVLAGIMVACIMGFITGIMVALNGSPFLLLLSPIAGVGIAIAILRSRADRRESVFDTRIYVSEVVINYPDPAKDFALTTVPIGTIDRLRIQQSIGNKALMQSASASPGVTVQNWGERSKAKWSNWIADHSYTLEVHAQGKRHVLAGGMDEITADGLMQAVSRKIRL
ncbi:MAG TPA: hypothetical protein VN039_00990 [Nitrospira sp.]|nr:hypothetical protein [Nitrospira sp.]